MYNERLTDQTLRKMKTVIGEYEKYIFEKVGEIEEAKYLVTKDHLREVPTEGLKELEKGMEWGAYYDNLWVIGKVTVPKEAVGKKLYAVSHAGKGEELFFINGVPAGMFSWKKMNCTGGAHDAQLICSDSKEGDVYDLAFECYAGHNYDDPAKEDMEALRDKYNGIDICVMNEKVKDFVFDVLEMLSLNEVLENSNMMKYSIRRALLKINEVMIKCPDERSKEDIMAGVDEGLKISRPSAEKITGFSATSV